MKGINIDTVAAAMRVFLERSGETLVYNDPANGERLRIEAGAAAATDGLLPAIVVAGESVWRDLTGKGFELDLARDPSALLGFQLRGIRGATFSIVMLASVEALHQVRHPEGVIVNDFNALWAAATENGQERVDSSARTYNGAAP
jgi:hypothetical protein